MRQNRRKHAQNCRQPIQPRMTRMSWMAPNPSTQSAQRGAAATAGDLSILVTERTEAILEGTEAKLAYHHARTSVSSGSASVFSVSRVWIWPDRLRHLFAGKQDVQRGRSAAGPWTLDAGPQTTDHGPQTNPEFQLSAFSPSDFRPPFPPLPPVNRIGPLPMLIDPSAVRTTSK